MSDRIARRVVWVLVLAVPASWALEWVVLALSWGESGHAGL